MRTPGLGLLVNLDGWLKQAIEQAQRQAGTAPMVAPAGQLGIVFVNCNITIVTTPATAEAALAAVSRASTRQPLPRAPAGATPAVGTADE